MTTEKFSVTRLSRAAFLRLRNFLSAASILMTSSLIIWMETQI